MFAALKTTIAMESAALSETTLDAATIDTLLVEYATIGQAMTQSDSAVEELFETRDNLIQLQATIQTHGLSQSLLAFVNKDNVLTASIKEVPSLESFTADLAADQAGAVVEGLGTSIKHVSKAILAGIKYDFTHLLSYNEAEKRVIVWDHVLEGVKKNLKDRRFDEAKAKEIKTSIMPYQNLMVLMKAYTGAPKTLLSLWEMELPKTEDEFKPWLEKVRTAVEVVFHPFEGKITDHGLLQVPLRRSLLLKFGAPGTVAEKGYTAESLDAIFTEFKRLTQAYSSLRTLEATAKKHIATLTASGEEHDRAVVQKAMRVYKNVTRELFDTGLWGVSAAAFTAITAIKKAYVEDDKSI